MKLSHGRNILRGFLALITVLNILGLIHFLPEKYPLSGNAEVAYAAADPVIAAAGDIACDPASSSFNGGNGVATRCRQRYTSDLLVNTGLDAVLPLGDNQYECGGYQAFLQSYDLSWGRVKSITHPVVGNHEYLNSGGTDCASSATGYFTYFGAAAGNPSQGYYSYDIGAWHVIAINSNCSDAGGCGSTSPQGQWLEADLNAHSNFCTLAYWHIPLFSSGGRAEANTQSIWQTLYNHNADLILNGHDHIYERFAPQAPNGTLDTARGIREFIVGSGGANHTTIASLAANSEVQNVDTFGVLKLTLHPTSYDWQFVPEAGRTFTDTGTTACHGSGPTPTPGPTSTPGPISTPTRTATSTANVTSTPTNTPNATQPGNTFTPLADAYVTGDLPTTNYGSVMTLRTDASPDVRSYLRFNVQGLNGPVTRATLRIYANSANSQGYQVRSVSDNTWSESTINYNNAPAVGSVLGTSGAITASTWTSADVTAYITGNGTYNLGLTSLSSTATSLASRESGANAPQLIIETQSGPTATPSSTPTATQIPTSTPTNILTDTPTPTLSYTLTSTPTATYTLTNTPTLAPTNTATPTTTPTPVIDPIFADGFESGDFSAWSSSATDGISLRVNSTSALIGNYGLQAIIDDNNSIYITDSTPNAEPRYRARFYFNPNSIVMADKDAFYLLYGYSGTSTGVLRVEFRYFKLNYQLRAALRNDGSGWTNSSWVNISDGPHSIEFDWQAATAAGGNNGSLALWIDGGIDGLPNASLTGIDNDTRRIDQIQFGAESGIDVGTRGTVYFDAFESRRQSYIGP
jgi:Calcineurin-like phosphoesterase